MILRLFSAELLSLSSKLLILEVLDTFFGLIVVAKYYKTCYRVLLHCGLVFINKSKTAENLDFHRKLLLKLCQALKCPKRTESPVISHRVILFFELPGFKKPSVEKKNFQAAWKGKKLVWLLCMMRNSLDDRTILVAYKFLSSDFCILYLKNPVLFSPINTS